MRLFCSAGTEASAEIAAVNDACPPGRSILLALTSVCLHAAGNPESDHE